MSKLTWSDIQNASQKDLKKAYKINDRQLEIQVRKHLDGACAQERREVYQKLYSKK